MKDNKIIEKLTHGMYVLTTDGGGCVVDAVAQVSGGELPLIAVSVMKKNYTNELIKKSGTFALSILDSEVDPSVIPNFGFRSGRDANKLDDPALTEACGRLAVKSALGCIVCKCVDAVENETHTLFIARVTDCETFRDGTPMSYGYYREHKDELLKVKTAKGKTAWVCSLCGYVYYGDEVPDGYVCPICGAGKDFFQKQE